MKRVEFNGKVLNRPFSGYIIYSADSAWIWIGDKSVSSIGLAHFPYFTMLADGDNAQREFIKSLTLRLAKKSRFTQVFFTTDYDCDDVCFWQGLNEVISTKLTELPIE